MTVLTPHRLAKPALPHGFRVELSDDTKVCDGGRLLLGTSSGVVLRLRPHAVERLRGRALVVSDATSATLARALLVRGLADPAWSDDSSRRDLSDLTVVVPVRDRPRQLDRLLATVPAGVPVMVVDDGSTDPSSVAAVATEHGAGLLRHDRSRGPSEARNAGIRSATTELVALIDSDVLLEPGTLTTLRRHLDDPAVAVVGPRVLSTEQRPTGWIARYEAARSSLDLGPRPARVAPGTRVSYLPSAALLVRRAALGDGFDGSMQVAEDVDLIWRLTTSGHEVRYAPEAVVRHEHRIDVRDWMNRKVFYGSGAQLLAERHGALVAPMRLSASSALAVAAVLAQRPWSAPVAVTALAAGGTRSAYRLRSVDHPVRTAVALTAMTGAGALWQTASSLTRHHWPAAVAAALVSQRARRAVIVAAVAEAVADHRRVRPDLDLARYAVAHRLDDLAYGWGLWAGAWRARSARALLPSLHERKL